MVPVILQTYNRISYTMQVISALKNHLFYPRFIIVIDNGSIDGTIDYLKFCKEQGLVDELILNSTNLGISEPKNQGLEVVKRLAETQEIKYVCISDNDIVPPFIRDNDGCVLTKIVEMMDKHPEVGMCGVDLNRDNAPESQSWWWRLRQHPQSNPTFAEISIGFWFSVIRYEFFSDFKFVGESAYGRCDESIRNYIGLVKKQRVGLLKGVYDEKTHSTIEKSGIHLGWTEDQKNIPEYVNFKKAERYKAELAWKAKDRKW